MNSVTLSSKSIVFLYFSALSDRNNIKKELKLATMKADAIMDILQHEMPELAEDEEIKNMRAELDSSLEKTLSEFPAYQAMQECLDSLQPFVDALREEAREEFDSIMTELGINEENIIATGEAKIEYKIIASRTGNKPETMTDDQKDKMKTDIKRNFDEIQKSIPKTGSEEGGINGE